MPAKHQNRVAIMIKGSALVAALALDLNYPLLDKSMIQCVGMLDPRCKPPVDLRGFETSDAAITQFHKLLAMSRDNGWTVAHLGERNFG